MAWRCALYTGLDWNDLYSEALLGWAEARKTYQPDKAASLSSWCYMEMTFRIKDFCARQKRHRNMHTKLPEERMEDQDLWSDEFLISDMSGIYELLDAMPEDGRNICRAILSAPEEFAGILPKMARGLVYQRMRDQGWSWSRIWKGFHEAKAALNTRKY